ncbi:hypothetical protein BJI67_08160 [Acidihalobacter aeolianus]|uniref:Uncharacterized protein n=2 Tax=Acidihalobacter aeolianus TaxID=2792603 RepID=A0A1D8K7U6_9GAMM|nr:hypothetical protein BJI67_08160 [Acidihalobacter aeolianus]
MELDRWKIRSAVHHFTSYTGVTLPLKLVNPLDDSALDNRNTYFRGYFDGDDRLILCQKVVYGEVELEHRYEYHPNGQLQRAGIKIFDEDSESVMLFDEDGTRIDS